MEVETTAELEAAVRERFPEADVLIMAAAPADFRPAEPADSKLLQGGNGRVSLELRADGGHRRGASPPAGGRTRR